MQYSEGIDVGYRWYDSQHLTPLFPFGFGLSYTRFAFSGLRVGPQSVDGVHDVRVSATVTNVGSRSGADVAQLYLGDPRTRPGEPPRRAGRLPARPAGSGPVDPRPVHHHPAGHLVVGRRSAPAGWNQTAGLYRVYLGDSSALANLPLRDAFQMTETPGARQVIVSAPSTMTPGKPSSVTVTLTASGNEPLRNVRLALQLPQGWSASSRRTEGVRPREAETSGRRDVHRDAAELGAVHELRGACHRGPRS